MGLLRACAAGVASLFVRVCIRAKCERASGAQRTSSAGTRELLLDPQCAVQPAVATVTGKAGATMYTTPCSGAGMQVRSRCAPMRRNKGKISEYYEKMTQATVIDNLTNSHLGCDLAVGAQQLLQAVEVPRQLCAQCSQGRVPRSHLRAAHEPAPVTSCCVLCLDV